MNNRITRDCYRQVVNRQKYFANLKRNGWSSSVAAHRVWWWPPVKLSGEILPQEAVRAVDMQQKGLLGPLSERDEGICFQEIPYSFDFPSKENPGPSTSAITVTTSVNSQVLAFLQLPATTLPNALFFENNAVIYDGLAFVLSPWDVLLQHVTTGEPIRSICGMNIRLQADVDSWRHGVIV